MRVFSQERRSTNNNIDTVHTRLDGDSSVVHVTSDMCQNLGVLETELADGFAMRPRLGRSSGGSELNVFDSKVVQSEVSVYTLLTHSAGIGRNGSRDRGFGELGDRRGDVQPRNFNLLLQSEESIGELFSLYTSISASHSP